MKNKNKLGNNRTKDQCKLTPPNKNFLREQNCYTKNANLTIQIKQTASRV